MGGLIDNRNYQPGEDPLKPGTIVKVRDRYWVLLPHEDPQVYALRPLTGSVDETLLLHKQLTDLLGYTLPDERPQPATFPLPTPEEVSNANRAALLWQAARLTLREGASPLRSLGRISIRPRVYQFVPLLMALRLDPVRMLIADDVGVGKTIEALLIARELWDRGEIKRLAVLCPPYLCDQWQKELVEKFNFHEAVVIRSSTLGQLERNKPPTRTIFEHYPVQVISIDWVKTERNRHAFLLHAPEFIIVDEAHGAAMAENQTQQLRHEFLREVAQDSSRHLILLTATPHSGVESAFRSLLGLLNPEFAGWDTGNLSEPQLNRLARHFVQRTRKDIESDWDDKQLFPKRVACDEAYELSPAYRKLFDETYAFCAEIVRTGQRLEERKRRVRYWGALALLRCVMSSPKAALAALETRQKRLDTEEALPLEEEENLFRGFIFESDQDQTNDEHPTPPIEEAEINLSNSERLKLRELSRHAEALLEPGQDTKLEGVIKAIQNLLSEGYHPIVWCRYVATAEYVAKALADVRSDLQVICITGRQADDERRDCIERIDSTKPRVLVATDCLSEGINLQEKFTAAIHYDLPWNPNRLEQREGRVDRYGQTAPMVKVIRYFGKDNPVDGVVLDVLLKKAHEIHTALGTYVPVPEDSESVVEAVLNALFLRGYSKDPSQLHFSFMDESVTRLHDQWKRDAEREKRTRTRFAQRALKPEEVRRELEACDAVLGDPDAVENFVMNAAQNLKLTLVPEKNAKVYRLDTKNLPPEIPDAIRFALPQRKNGMWRISFTSPTPEGAEYIGRNHPFVAALARFLFEEALTRRDGQARASRGGVIATRAVNQPTTLLLLRVRYLIKIPDQTDLFSEEVRVLGYTMRDSHTIHWLPDDEALRLLEQAQPDANVTGDKRAIFARALETYRELEDEIRRRLIQRAYDLTEAHKRIRQAVRLRVRELTVEPQEPPDLLGMLVLLPQGGVQ